ncbi:MAG: hypothetical protein EOM21_17750 [Gammaproteobacteria bacterium]|nr:hypothetical protein [Gammaproteobacteria bacterium]
MKKIKAKIREKEVWIHHFEIGNPNISFSTDSKEAKELGDITALYLFSEIQKNRDVQRVEIIEVTETN